MRTILSIAAAMFAIANAAHGDIFQWVYINPADPSQGKRQSTTLAPDGAGVDAVPGANLYNRNLTMAYLIGADLMNASGYASNLTDAGLSQANLTNANFGAATLTDADFTGAAVRGASFATIYYSDGTYYLDGTGITLAQLYSTASYQAHDLSGTNLIYNNLAGGNFAGQNLTNANFGSANLTDADFRGAIVRGANLAYTGITLAQLYSTASYQAQDLSGVNFASDNLAGGNFVGQNLTDSDFYYATLTDADFTGAEVRGVRFGGTGLTAAQLYSTASYHAHDLTGIELANSDQSGGNFAGFNLTNANFFSATLTGSNFRDADLTNASLWAATLTDADFTGAEVRGANFFSHLNPSCGPDCGVTILPGITLAQLYSTASFHIGDLSGIKFSYNGFADGNFAGQNLTNAIFESTTLTDANFREANLTNASFAGATLTYANFTGADVRGASFGNGGSCSAFVACPGPGTGISLPQLYSTASYQALDLTGIDLGWNRLNGGTFSGQNLSYTNFFAASLTDADFAGAHIRGATFAKYINPLAPQRKAGTGITLPQLYSTESYQTRDLSGVRFDGNDLSGGNFAGQNLTNATFVSAELTGADFTGADIRGAQYFDLSGATTANLIWPNGDIIGLDLNSGGLLVVRDYEGHPLAPQPMPIPVTVDQHLSIGPGGTLRMVFEADAWDSTISFAPGIPVTLDGTLELTFAADVNLASQRGRTFDLFDWTGVHPTGAFAVSSPYAWNLSNLYTTGEVTLTAVPEPTTLAMLLIGALVILAPQYAGIAMPNKRKEKQLP